MWRMKSDVCVFLGGFALLFFFGFGFPNYNRLVGVGDLLRGEHVRPGPEGGAGLEGCHELRGLGAAQRHGLESVVGVWGRLCGVWRDEV